MKTTLLLCLVVVTASQADVIKTPPPAKEAAPKFSPSLPVSSYIVEKLALTPEQQAKMAELKTQYGTDYGATLAKNNEANKPLFEELRALKPGENPARRKEINDQVQKNNQSLQVLIEQYRAKFVALLTAEQKAKYTALEAEAKLPQLVSLVTLDKLQLSAEQQAKYEALLKEYRAEVQKNAEPRKKLTDELTANPGIEKTKELQKQLGELFRTESNLRNRYTEQLKALLTDEQKTKFQEGGRVPLPVRARAK